MSNPPFGRQRAVNGLSHQEEILELVQTSSSMRALIEHLAGPSSLQKPSKNVGT
jgi:hypothetical protein